MSSRSTFLSRHGAPLAAACFFVALVGFAFAVDGYSHQIHPVAVLGGRTMPAAWAFNLLAFIVPGLLMAWQAWRLREALEHPHPARWPARVGAQTLQLSALAFAAQGVLPLDLSDLESPESARHAAAWMIWWLAFTVGGALLVIGLRGRPRWRALTGLTLLVAPLLPVCAMLLPHVMAAGSAQRLGLLLWFAWGVGCGRLVNRSAASSPGSSRTG